jgi:hypothetical protein
MSDGVELNCDVFRPDAVGAFPAIVGVHGYSLSMQSDPIKPNSFSSVAGLHPGEEKPRGSIEAGDPWFYARRGYAHVILNVRGTGDSGGLYGFMDSTEAQDIKQAIEWLADRPWCNGEVGMFGVSYFAIMALATAAIRPPHLRCVFAPWGGSERYDRAYHGGILNAGWLVNWMNDLDRPRIESVSVKELGEGVFWERVEELKADQEITAVPRLRAALEHPLEGTNALIVDILLHPTMGPYWEDRTPNYEAIDIPVYMGACWGTYGLHLRSLSETWKRIGSFKRMVIGPPAYLDRPVHQMQYESLRWFDHWLKGVDTEVESDPPVQLFLMGENRWIAANEWPLEQTRWVPFNLHEGELLAERDHWWEEGQDAFFDSPWHRGSLEYWTAPLADRVNVIGPLMLELYAASWRAGTRWIVTLLKKNVAGEVQVLTKGTLDGAFLLAEGSDPRPYAIKHDYSVRRPQAPQEVHEYSVPIVPTGTSFERGSRLGIRIACADAPARNPLEGAASGHIRGQDGQRVIVYHNDHYPSCLWVPIESGNLLGTFISGGRPYFNNPT